MTKKTPTRCGGRATVCRRGVQRQPGARRLGLRPPPSGLRQGTPAGRRGTRNHQQPHGNDRRHPRPGGPEAAHARRIGHRQHLRRQGADRVAAQVEVARLATRPARKCGQSRTRTFGGGSTSCCNGTRSASSTSAATAATPKTSVATCWPWPPIRSSCDRGNPRCGCPRGRSSRSPRRSRPYGARGFRRPGKSHSTGRRSTCRSVADDGPAGRAPGGQLGRLALPAAVMRHQQDVAMQRLLGHHVVQTRAGPGRRSRGCGAAGT